MFTTLSPHRLPLNIPIKIAKIKKIVSARWTMERGKGGSLSPLYPLSMPQPPDKTKERVHNGNFPDDFDRHNRPKISLQSRSIDTSTWTIMLILGLSPLKNLVYYFANV